MQLDRLNGVHGQPNVGSGSVGFLARVRVHASPAADELWRLDLPKWREDIATKLPTAGWVDLEVRGPTGARALLVQLEDAPGGAVDVDPADPPPWARPL